MTGTSVITGGATGIGYAMAAHLLAGGGEVLICGRREQRLAQAGESLPGVRTLCCDVTDPADRVRLVDFVADTMPGVAMLVNNAGIQRDIDLTNPAGLEGESEIAVNLEAPIALSALFTPLLAGKPGATIVNVSSALAFMVERATRCPVYCATKAGLHAFSIAQRIQLAPLGIRVVEIIPPAVESELNMESRQKRGFVTSPNMMSAAEFVEKAMAQMDDGTDEIRVGMKWKES